MLISKEITVTPHIVVAQLFSEVSRKKYPTFDINLHHKMIWPICHLMHMSQ